MVYKSGGPLILEALKAEAFSSYRQSDAAEGGIRDATQEKDLTRPVLALRWRPVSRPGERPLGADSGKIRPLVPELQRTRLCQQPE